MFEKIFLSIPEYLGGNLFLDSTVMLHHLISVIVFGYVFIHISANMTRFGLIEINIILAQADTLIECL